MRHPISLIATSAAVTATTLAGVAVVTSSSAAPAPVSTVRTNPADFSRPQANPWFPLEPGTVTTLRGSDEGERYREKVRVTHRTRTIQGVETKVVRDVVRRRDGSVSEATTDWYAEDNDGNVWYFGEDTATYDESGQLEDRAGTWRAGVRGADAGIIMPADPEPTDAYRQELDRGNAEDQAWVVGFKPSVSTPMRRFRHVLRTFEWTRLEPKVVSTKLYARGVGIVREMDVAGGDEVFEVVALRHP